MNEPQRRKMELYLARFVEAMAAWGWSRRSIPAYAHNLAVFVAWLDRETDVTSLAEVSPQTLGAYQTALLGEEPAAGARLAASTQHLRLTAVRAFFSYLAKEGALLDDPARGLQLPKRRRALPQALLTPEEAVRLVESIDTATPLGQRDRAIVEVLYATGIRASELCGLRLADFDPGGATLTVRAGKGNKDRVVPLGPLAGAALSAYIAEGRGKLLQKRAGPEIFLSKRGQPLHRGNLAAVVARAARNAGIKKPVRPHRLRHACATHMLRGGADIRHIQKLLGHASLATTEVYTRVEIADLQAVHRRFHPREKGS